LGFMIGWINDWDDEWIDDIGINVSMIGEMDQ
jgi:hypothetical protein